VTASHEARRRIRHLRGRIPKRDRDKAHGVVDAYCPSCSGIFCVGLAEGVEVMLLSGTRLPAPTEVPCIFSDCEGAAEVDHGSYRHVGPMDDAFSAYLRIPSRRAAKEMISRGVVEAQMVVVS
jgi:hypothetical protein